MHPSLAGVHLETIVYLFMLHALHLKFHTSRLTLSSSLHLILHTSYFEIHHIKILQSYNSTYQYPLSLYGCFCIFSFFISYNPQLKCSLSPSVGLRKHIGYSKGQHRKKYKFKPIQVQVSNQTAC